MGVGSLPASILARMLQRSSLSSKPLDDQNHVAFQMPFSKHLKVVTSDPMNKSTNERVSSSKSIKLSCAGQLAPLNNSASGQEPKDSCSGIQLFDRDHQGDWETHKRNLLHFFIKQQAL
ncbi:unnamed protein product [Rangifer tarandus platyrhynchus]|uniref:Uncharacterized protein n=2 Tax=Rangifer tarandus platyrhynchus TaxID=3082113 RepID=A0AC60A246_RANTA|nr:unnamed protein product [Rangifer tarandus platyrhynchus]